MRKLFVGVICALVLCGAAFAAPANPSFFGPTGLIAMPTADSLGMGQANAFVNFVDWDDGDETAYGANVGLGFGVELGIAQVRDGGSETIVNAKWNLKKETLLTPGIAIGAVNIARNRGFTGSFTTNDDGKIDPYIVLSKRLSMPATSLAVSGHAGYIGGNVEQVMVGASADLSSKLRVMADYINDFSNLSIGVRYAVTDEWQVGANSLDGNLSLSASYRFGIR